MFMFLMCPFSPQKHNPMKKKRYQHYLVSEHFVLKATILEQYSRMVFTSEGIWQTKHQAICWLPQRGYLVVFALSAVLSSWFVVSSLSKSQHFYQLHVTFVIIPVKKRTIAIPIRICHIGSTSIYQHESYIFMVTLRCPMKRSTITIIYIQICSDLCTFRLITIAPA